MQGGDILQQKENLLMNKTSHLVTDSSGQSNKHNLPLLPGISILLKEIYIINRI